MKIAFLIGGFPRISETFILSQITGLIDLGCDVKIIAEIRGGSNEAHHDVEKYRLMERVYYYPELPQTKTVLRLKTAWTILKLFVCRPIRTFTAVRYLLAHKEGFSHKRFYYALPFIREKFDIVHCHFGTKGHLGMEIKSMGMCNNLIVTFYGYDASQYVKVSGRDCYKELFEQGDMFLALSGDMRQRLIKLGCPEEKVRIHHVGENPEKFKFKKRFRASGGPVKFLTAARFTEKKGLEYSIRAFSELFQRRPDDDFVYTIVGDGPLRGLIESLIVELRMGDKVLLVGTKTLEELIELFGESDIFVLTSVTAEDGDEEGTPTVLIEAICSGLPVISTRHAGIPDIIIDKEAGFLVDERDVDATSEKLQYLIENPQLWEQMGRRGREHFDREFDINILNKKLIKIYEDVLTK
jgi:colanic acid/amylovoran biosynthesis glycosyltransferase